MITVNIANVRSAEVTTMGSTGPFVTLRFGNNDRCTIFTKSTSEARALAAIFNGALQQEVGK